ncbi:hypothetical protein JTE90_023474 [Oedothorax gibbosus]|uniref:Uncharacterized protein n=1 Tax=Oedothorax gibbosus TaxID=931172 RepID=A0AAV6VPG3_9ARAC|nr:hypothetical protein JTE90_023474 [Oedothorax gibbosus]
MGSPAGPLPNPFDPSLRDTLISFAQYLPSSLAANEFLRRSNSSEFLRLDFVFASFEFEFAAGNGSCAAISKVL